MPGRKLLQGKACKKTEVNGNTEYDGISNIEVLKLLAFAPSHVELQVRRIKWYQSMAKITSDNTTIITAMFAQFPFEPHPTIFDNTLNTSEHQKNNPWAEQFYRDIQALEHIEDAQALLLDLSGRFILVLSQFAEEFCEIDASTLRVRAIRMATLPEGFDPLNQNKFEDQQENPWICPVRKL